VVIINKKKIPEKISRVLFSDSNCIVKIHVWLHDNNNEFMHKEFNLNGNIYVSLNPRTCITIEKYSKEWDKSKNLLLNEVQLQSVINGMKKIIKNIYEKNIFANKPNGEIIIYSDEANKCSEIVRFVNSTNILLLKPSVLVDENDVTYEAVTMYINRVENDIQLSIGSFESLYNILSKINLFMYSQLLINYVFSVYSEDDETNVVVHKTNKIDFNKPDSTVSTKFVNKNNKTNIFEGLSTVE